MRVKMRCSGKPSPEQLQLLSVMAGKELKVYPYDYEYAYMRGTLEYGEFSADPAIIAAEPRLRGLDFTISGGDCEVGAWNALVTGLQEMVARVERRLALISTGLDSGKTYVEAQQLNTRVSVHVPGLGLLLVDEVEMEENCCTDELQRRLDDGWRILAICPQPDQRRPDYVLGRTKK